MYAAVPSSLRCLDVGSLSAPGVLPGLLRHLEAEDASHSENDSTVPIPAEMGDTEVPAISPIILARLLRRGAALGWGRGGQLQLLLLEGGSALVSVAHTPGAGEVIQSSA